MINKLMARFGRRKRPTHPSIRKNPQTTTKKVMKSNQPKLSKKSTMETAQKKRLRPISTHGIETDAFDDTDFVVAAAEDQQRAIQEALETETLAREAAPKRWDATINPSSGAFKAKHKEFRTALRDPAKNTYGILESCFTAHEKAMLIPVDRRSNPALYKIQADNRVRYQALLKSDRFMKWTARADLAFKFTLMHYGLPVAPMNVGFEPDLSDWEDDSDEDEALQQNNRPPDGHLRFLNNYAVRHFGQRSVRNPDPTYENYYTFEGLNPVDPKTAIFPIGLDPGDTLTLRGGGDSDDMDIDVDRFDAELDLEPVDLPSPETDAGDAQLLSMVVSLRGGANSPAPETDSIQKSNRQGYQCKKSTRLYGFQGFVHFDFHYISTFIDAFDRVLGVGGAREEIQVLLAVYDRTVDYYATEDLPKFLAVTMGPHDDHTDFEKMLKWVAPYITKPDSHSKYALFVCPSPVLLPRKYEPDGLAEQEMMLLKVDNSEQPRDCAYLRIPPNTQDLELWHENIYSPWIESAARLLSPDVFGNNPGQPVIPDAYFGGRADPDCTPSYGGLSFPPEEFASLISTWKEKQPIEMFATHLLRVLEIPELREIGWPLHIPGHSLPIDVKPWGITYDMADMVVGTIEASIDEALHPVAFEMVSHIDVWFPGDRIYLPRDIGKYTIAVSHDGSELAENDSNHPLPQALQRLLRESHENDQLLLNPQFISASPRWSEYSFFDAINVKNGFTVDEKNMNLSEFLREMDAFGASISSGRPFVWSEASISISHASCDWESPPESRVEVVMPKPTLSVSNPIQNINATPVRDTSRPSFLITQETTADDFQVIFRKITSPYLVVEVIYSNPELATNITEQPWGYCDIYSIKDIFGKGKHGRKDLWRGRYPQKISVHSAKPTASTKPAASTKPVTSTRRAISTKSMESTKPATSTKPVSPTKSTTSTKPMASSKAATKPSGNTEKGSVRFAAPPLSQVAQSKPQGGIPPNIYGLKPAPPSQPLSDQEKGRQMRELTWDKAPSVHTHMTVPINAPPVEAILKTGTDSVPSFSLGVLTPTEQQKMRMDYYNIRNIALQRSQKCPYYGCKRVFKISENDKLQNHLLNIHTAEKCNFCDNLLYKHWNEDQRQHHFISNHYHSFVHDKDLRKQNNKIKIPFEGHVNRERESLWNFCARCGRDHRELDVNADRNNHDNICYPSVLDPPNRWEPCHDCGQWIGNSRTHPHQCRQGADPAERPYCSRCALPLGGFTSDYLLIHAHACKGRNNVDDKFCPWCGIDLGDSSGRKLGHLRVCGKRPDEGAEGPIDLETGKLWPSPAEIRASGTPIVAGAKQKASPAADVTILEKEVRALREENVWLKGQQAEEIARLKKIGEEQLLVELEALKDQLSALMKGNMSSMAQTSQTPTSLEPGFQPKVPPQAPTPQPKPKSPPQASTSGQGTTVTPITYLRPAKGPTYEPSTQPAKISRSTRPRKSTRSTSATRVTETPSKPPEASRGRKRKTTEQTMLPDDENKDEGEFDGWGGGDAVTGDDFAMSVVAPGTGPGRRPLKRSRRIAERDPRFRTEGSPPSDKEHELTFADFVRKSGGLGEDI